MQQSNWYILLTEPSRDGTAVAGLVTRGFTAFGPSVFSKRLVVKNGKPVKDAHGRKTYKRIQKPMFPGYAFVAFDRGGERFEAARKVAGVRGWLCIEGNPARVPGAAIEAIKVEEARQLDAYEAAQTPFVAGMTGRVAEGAYTDWVGKIVRVSKSGRLSMLLDLLGREVTVEIDAGQVRAA